MENTNMKSYNNGKLSDNICEVYIGDKRKSIKNKSTYILSCASFLQILFGNERSFKFSFIVSSISGIVTVISNMMFNINEDDYKESIENLNNVTKELILLGYDLNGDALYDGTLYKDGVIEFSDKYDNNYYVYEKEENGYYKYYELANGDLDTCLKDEMMHNDITNVIRRGLNKSKQDKK